MPGPSAHLHGQVSGNLFPPRYSLLPSSSSSPLTYHHRIFVVESDFFLTMFDGVWRCLTMFDDGSIDGFEEIGDRWFRFISFFAITSIAIGLVQLEMVWRRVISLEFTRSDLFLCYLILWYVLIVYCIEICFFWFGLIRFEENPWFLWVLLGSISYIINDRWFDLVWWAIWLIEMIFWNIVIHDSNIWVWFFNLNNFKYQKKMNYR